MIDSNKRLRSLIINIFLLECKLYLRNIRYVEPNNIVYAMASSKSYYEEITINNADSRFPGNN